MTQFYIVEIKQLANGDYEHNVFYEYDADADIAQLKAESKYHKVLGDAATSVAAGTTKQYSAILFSTEGFPLMHGCYKNPHGEQPIE